MNDLHDKNGTPLALPYPEFMCAVVTLSYDRHECAGCGGTGAMAEVCCSGDMCGCRGLPIDFVKCTECEHPFPTDDELREAMRKAGPMPERTPR